MKKRLMYMLVCFICVAVLFGCAEEKHISDDEYFPAYVKAHLDRGAVLLDQEQRYSKDFLVHLTQLEKGI